MPNREAVLRRALHAWRASSFVWGERDCLMSVFDYARELCGSDPGATWRGQYSDEAGALAFLKEAGGMVPLTAFALQPLGFKRVQLPARGDIIIADVRLPLPLAGLCLGDRAAFRMLRGVGELRMSGIKVEAAWRAPSTS